MSYIIPSKDLTIKQKESYRGQVLDTMMSRALSTRTILDEAVGLMRELLPSDLGLKNWVTPEQKAGEDKVWIAHNVNHRQISIYKILQLSSEPGVSQITFIRNGSIEGIHPLESIYGSLPFWKLLASTLLSPQATKVLERLAGKPIKMLPDIVEMEGYFSEPYIFDREDRVEITLLTSQPTPGDTLYLGGLVVEPVG